MPKLATGAIDNHDRPAAGPMTSVRRVHGFTLVEILVVVVIAGVLTGAVLLVLGRTGPGQANQRELSRLAASLEAMCDQALLSGTARGLRFHQDGYDFWRHSAAGWQALPADDKPSPVRWPEGLRVRIEVESLVLGPARNARSPQIVCTGIEPPTPFVIELGAGEHRKRMNWPR